jgi:hypothetical protein
MSLNKCTIQKKFSILSCADCSKTYKFSIRYISSLFAFDYFFEKTKLIQKTSVNILKNDLGDQYE